MSWRLGVTGKVVWWRSIGRWRKIEEMQVAKVQRDRWAAQLKDNKKIIY
jgi:hypothetical protein